MEGLESSDSIKENERGCLGMILVPVANYSDTFSKDDLQRKQSHRVLRDHNI
jgi:hypothetical protein